MSVELTAPRSRRALLAAAAGAAVATVASAIDRPVPVLAASDGDVVLGAPNTAPTMTSIAGSTKGITVLEARGATDPGADGVAIHGVMTFSGAGDERTGIGILGEGEACSTGVEGRSGTGDGVRGRSESGTGTHGSSHHGTGVGAFSDDGTGLEADSTRGTGLHASSRMGSALKVHGKVQLNRSGRAWIEPGRRFVTVEVDGGLAGTPLCFANLLSYRWGVWVTAVRPNYPSGGRLRIYLNKAVASRSAVAWMVLDSLGGPAPWEL